MPNEQVSPPVGKAGRPKSAQKRLDILGAAAELFLQHGFSATSMDLVARSAGVSKQTVYSHFSNKDALFTAVIGWKCVEHQLDTDHMGGADTSIEDVLTQVGNQFVNLLRDPQAIAMYRVVIAEGASNPHISEMFYNAGPQNAIELVCKYLQNQSDLGLDHEAAHHFTIMFFSMLKGEFHMYDLMGLPFEMNIKQQRKGVEQVVEHVLSLLEHHIRGRV